VYNLATQDIKKKVRGNSFDGVSFVSFR
jgi:hypothetical protein